MSECAFLKQGGGQVLFGLTQAGGRVSPEAPNAVAVKGGFVGDEHEVA